MAKTLLQIELQWGDTRLHLFATHLASRWNPQEPSDEVVSILKVLPAVAQSPQVLVGDMNALRPDDPVDTPPQGEAKRGDAIDGAPRLAMGRLLEAGYVDCFRQLHPRISGFTYPSTVSWLRLDYIFASPPIAKRLDACNVMATQVARRASDHVPVCARFG